LIVVPECYANACFAQRLVDILRAAHGVNPRVSHRRVSGRDRILNILKQLPQDNVLVVIDHKVGNDVIVVAKGPGALAYAKMPNITQTPAATPQSTPTSTSPSPTLVNAQNNTAAFPATTTAMPVVNAPHTQASTAPPLGAVSPTAAAPPTVTPAGPGSADSPSPSGQLLLAIGVAAALAALAAVLVRGRRGGGRGGATVAGLSEVDERILAYLRERGGAYESEIARELGIPRTTVFRAVRRLEEAGLVVVEKRGGRNFVRIAG